MLRKERKTAGGNVAIQVGRMGAGMDTVKTKDGASVNDVLKENDYEIGENENVFVNGTKVEKSRLSRSTVSRGTIIAIVGAKEGGR